MSFVDDLKHKAADLADKAKDVASEAADKAKDVAGDVGEKAQHLATEAKDKVGDLTHKDNAADTVLPSDNETAADLDAATDKPEDTEAPFA